MRFLKPTSPYHLRLGFLRIIASLVKDQRVSREEPLEILREDLAVRVDRWKPWLDEAGFSAAPQGNVGRSHIGRLARMGIAYGIYDESTGALTDLGHVLRIVAPFQDADNPFAWRGAARWIGFFIIVRAAGDVVLPLLRDFPTEPQTNAETTKALSQILSALAQDARGERDTLRDQAKRASPEHKGYDAKFVLYPYVEPLRDLGYVERTTLVGGGAGYRLTEAGARLKTALLPGMHSADSLLRSGISRLFLLGEGCGDLHPATGGQLAEVLSDMPAELTVLRAEEVPLDATVLLAQARLIDSAPGAWIDPTRAHAIVEHVGKRGGKVEIKRGRSTDEFNIAWTDAAVLAEKDLWNVDVASDHPFPTARPETKTDEQPPSLAPTPEVIEEPAPLSPPTERDTSVNNASAEEQEKTNHWEDLSSKDLSTPLRLWLQYVDALLAPPMMGTSAIARWGGLKASLRRLESLLEDLPADKLKEKRSKRTDIVLGKPENQYQPLCLQPLKHVESAMADREEEWITRRMFDVWLDKDSAHDPQPAVSRRFELVPSIAEKLRKSIDAFLKLASSDKTLGRHWEAVREATRCILHDAIADGLGNARSLRELLRRELRDHAPQDAARRFLDTFFTAAREARYTQHRPMQISAWKELGLDDVHEDASIEIRILKGSPDESISFVELAVSVSGRTEFEVKQHARHRIHDWLIQRFLGHVDPGRDRHFDLAEPRSEEVEDSLREPKAPPLTPEEFKAPIPGLSTTRPTSEPRQTRMPIQPHGETSRELARVKRAHQELLDTRRPGLRGEQRVMLAWMALERLLAGSRHNKADTITFLAPAAALLHLRAWFATVLQDARAGLWFSACVDPQAHDSLVSTFLPDLSDEQRAFLEPGVLRDTRLMRQMDALSPVNEGKALELLWNHRADLPHLRNALHTWAPLASTGVHKFLEVTGDGKDKTEFKEVGDGKKLADHFRGIYEDIASFFARVYEIRNRATHGGAGGLIEYEHETQAADIHQRFLVLTEPVLDAIERRVEKGASLERVMGLALEKAQDLAALPHRPDGANPPTLSIDRLLELLRL